MERIRAESYLRAAQKGKEDHERESDEIVLDAAYQKAVETETDRVNMDDFEEIYGTQVLTEDQKKVQELEEGFLLHDLENSREARRIGKILEMIVTEQIELNNWFGENARTQQTTAYDDYLNGIDSLVEFDLKEGKGFFGLAIDVTHGKINAFEKKMKKTRRLLQDGKLGTVKYFRSFDGDIQGRMTSIPRVILALDREQVIDIAKLWVRGEQHALAEHPVQDLLSLEIIAQLEAQSEYARDHGYEKIAELLLMQKRMMEKIREERKRKLDDPSWNLEENRTYILLKEQLKRIFKQGE